jgi:hypothetical protein
MASLSNINGLFDVHSTGAILFSTSHGTSGQILRSNGNAAPTWVAASTVIGGPYLPLTGGTLSGPLSGTSATFSGGLNIGTYIRIDNANTDYNIIQRNNAGYALYVQQRGTGSIAQFSHGTGSAGSAGTNVVDITQGGVTVAGDVLIRGTYNPYASANRANIALNGSAGNIISFTNNTSGKGYIYHDNTDLKILNAIAGNLIFYTNSTEGMRIDSSGDTHLQGNLFFEGSTSYVAGYSIRRQGANFIFTGGTTGTFFNRNGNGATDIYINASGLVGIGATVPTNQLHVHTETDNAYGIRIEGSTNNVAGVWTGLGIGGEGANTKSAILFEDTVGSYSRGKLHLCVNNGPNQDNATPADAKLTITPAGNVGIGTSDPVTKLELKSPTVGSITNDRETTTSAFVINGSNENMSLQFGLGNATLNYGNWIQSGYDNGTPGSSPLYLNPIGGNVGIGTVSPAEKLQVAGNIRMFSAGYPLIDMGITTSNYFRLIHDNPNDVFKIGKNGAGTLNITGGGNVGIGTAGPEGKLNIETNAESNVPALGANTTFLKISNTGGAYGAMIGQLGSGNSYIQSQRFDGTATAYNLLLQPNGGNVGIGTTSPSAKLHVQSAGSTDVVFKLDNTNVADTAGAQIQLICDSAGSGDGNGALRHSIRSEFSGAINWEIHSGASHGDLNFSCLDSFAMIINSELDVGIGTTSPRAKLEVAGDITIQNGVYTYVTSGTTAGTTNINFDITVGNEGGQGNVFKIEAGFAHYYAMNYNAVAEWWCTSRGTAVVNTYILNANTTFGGGWSASKPNTTTLRITKSAGTYGGTGKYWVKVTYVPF